MYLVISDSDGVAFALDRRVSKVLVWWRAGFKVSIRRGRVL